MHPNFNAERWKDPRGEQNLEVSKRLSRVHSPEGAASQHWACSFVATPIHYAWEEGGGGGEGDDAGGRGRGTEGGAAEQESREILFFI